MKPALSNLGAIGLALVVLLAGCSRSEMAGSARLKVVASTAPVFDALGSVGGKRVHASNLLSIDPYALLTPAKEKALREASLAVIIGGGIQPEVERIAVERTKPTVRILDEVANVSSANPYVWLDPGNMMVIGSIVRTRLTEIDPAGEKTYRKNEARMARMLNDIERLDERTFATCQRREVVTTSSHFGYLMNRFDLAEVRATDATLPQVIDRVHPTTVFFASLPRLAEAKRIRRDLGVRSATLDDMAVRTDQARRGGASYGSLMALNLDALREALDCKKVHLGDK